MALNTGSLQIEIRKAKETVVDCLQLASWFSTVEHISSEKLKKKPIPIVGCL